MHRRRARGRSRRCCVDACPFELALRRLGCFVSTQGPRERVPRRFARLVDLLCLGSVRSDLCSLFPGPPSPQSCSERFKDEVHPRRWQHGCRHCLGCLGRHHHYAHWPDLRWLQLQPVRRLHHDEHRRHPHGRLDQCHARRVDELHLRRRPLRLCRHRAALDRWQAPDRWLLEPERHAAPLLAERWLERSGHDLDRLREPHDRARLHGRQGRRRHRLDRQRLRRRRHLGHLDWHRDPHRRQRGSGSGSGRDGAPRRGWPRCPPSSPLLGRPDS